jgi:hypothetical protein
MSARTFGHEVSDRPVGPYPTYRVMIVGGLA